MSRDPVCPHLARFRVWGLWDVDDAQRFGAKARALVAAMPVPFGQHVSVLDITAFKIQPQIVVQACLEMVMQGLVGRRSAFVIGEGLARIQVKRVTGTADIRTFDDHANARAWLLD